MSNADDTYTLRVEQPDDRVFADYETLFAQNGAPRMPGILSWRYLENPGRVGSVLTFARREPDGEIGALYAAMAVRLRLGQQSAEASQSLDTMTDRAHRRKGLFPKLSELYFTTARERSLRLIYGFPNSASGPIFEKSLGWTLFGPVDLLVRPLNTGVFLSRLPQAVGRFVPGFFRFNLPLWDASKGSLEFRAIREFGTQHEVVWRDFSVQTRIAVDRSADYLNWRIFRRPDGGKYQAVEAVENGMPIGFVVWCVEKKHGTTIGYLMDCLVLNGRKDAYRALVRHALRSMQSGGADLAFAWTNGVHVARGWLKSEAFVRLPEALKPIKLTWGYRSFVDHESFVASDWYISYLDSDTV